MNCNSPKDVYSSTARGHTSSSDCTRLDSQTKIIECTIRFMLKT